MERRAAAKAPAAGRPRCRSRKLPNRRCSKSYRAIPERSFVISSRRAKQERTMKVSPARDSLVDEAYALNTIALHSIGHLHGAGQRRLEAADAAADLQHNAISTEKIPAF